MCTKDDGIMIITIIIIIIIIIMVIIMMIMIIIIKFCFLKKIASISLWGVCIKLRIFGRKILESISVLIVQKPAQP